MASAFRTVQAGAELSAVSIKRDGWVARGPSKGGFSSDLNTISRQYEDRNKELFLDKLQSGTARPLTLFRPPGEGPWQALSIVKASTYLRTVPSVQRNCTDVNSQFGKTGQFPAKELVKR